MIRRSRFSLAIAAVGALAVFGIAPAAQAASDRIPQLEDSPSSDVAQPDFSLLSTRFSVPTEFDVALKIAASYDSTVGVRFENDQVVGEYFFDSDKSPKQFLEQFAEMYGTVPQVAALIAAVPYRAPASENGGSRSAYTPLPEIQVDAEAFEAPPISTEKFSELRAHSRGPAESRASEGMLAPMALTATPTWEPSVVYAGTVRSGSSQYFYNSIDWYTPYSPSNLTGPIAVEIEINLDNGASGVRGSVLPWELCGSNFRDQFIAKNYSLNSWSVSSPLGSVAAAYPYADLNDLFDSCGRNSMAVGLASAYDLPSGPPGPFSSLETFIDAKIGTKTSSKISGQIQLSNNSACPFDGSIAYTDCVGISPWNDSRFANPRLTLNPTRGWTAATNRCWISGSYGGAAPISDPC